MFVSWFLIENAIVRIGFPVKNNIYNANDKMIIMKWSRYLDSALAVLQEDFSCPSATTSKPPPSQDTHLWSLLLSNRTLFRNVLSGWSSLALEIAVVTPHSPLWGVGNSSDAIAIHLDHQSGSLKVTTCKHTRVRWLMHRPRGRARQHRGPRAWVRN